MPTAILKGQSVPITCRLGQDRQQPHWPAVRLTLLAPEALADQLHYSKISVLTAEKIKVWLDAHGTSRGKAGCELLQLR